MTPELRAMLDFIDVIGFWLTSVCAVVGLFVMAFLFVLVLSSLRYRG